MDSQHSDLSPQIQNQEDEPLNSNNNRPIAESGKVAEQPNPEPQTVAGRIMLTSRRTKKHVAIQDEASNRAEISNVEEVIVKLENNFASGVEEIRESLKVLLSERSAFELHIRTLEEFVRKSSQEKEKNRSVMQQMKNDIEMLTVRVEAMKLQNETLQKENKSLHSRHEDHLNSIAEQHRRKLIEKKTFQKWKGKLHNNVASRDQVAALLEENQRLKRELLQYQESAKHAFLRSANVLNSEAITLFQDTATRRLNTPPLDDRQLESSYDDANSIVTGSDEASNLTVPDGVEGSRNKENEANSRHREERNPSRISSSREGIKRNIEYLSDDSRTNERKRNLKEKTKYQTETQYLSGLRSSSRFRVPISDYHPDPLRQETRHIMKQLETNKKISSEFSGSVKSKKDPCQFKTHVHMCHCVPLPGQPGNCPYCFAHQNYNFTNMPIAPKAKPKSSVQFDSSKKERNRSYDCVSGERSKVIYKPSGSTVVIEKHL